MRKLFYYSTLGILLAGCGTPPPYTRGDGPTRQFSDAAVRYGSVAAAGAGGFFLGKELTGSTAGGVAAGALGAAAIYGFNRYSDRKRMDAYLVGIKAGEEMARAEIVNEIYRREAIYGLPPEGQETNQFPQIRNVYVPAREINGVEFKGDYQRVPVYK